MNRMPCLVASAVALTMVVALGRAADAATTLTQQLLINFDGSLSGSTYTLGGGEIDNSGTFAANGATSVSGGIADIAGDTNPSSGFYFDAGLAGLGIPLTTTNWISETLVSIDVPVAQQPVDASGGAGRRNNHVLDVQGDTFYRFNGQDPNAQKFTEFGYWDGASEQTVAAQNMVPNDYNHVALVWDAAGTILSAYHNGHLRGTVDLGAFDTSSPYVGYGWFARDLALPGNPNIGGRAIDGSLDAVAFSTFTGSFDPDADFQLNVVPEPVSPILFLMALAALLPSRRR